jgi:hypothetical protein
VATTLLSIAANQQPQPHPRPRLLNCQINPLNHENI